MIDFDFIIVSDAKTHEHKQLTLNCIKSIFDTATIYTPHIIVVEANKNTTYDGCITLHYDFEFNYNKCLNYGLKHSFSMYKALCNNDIFFHEDWCEDIIKGFKMGYGSLSPYCLTSHKNKAKVGSHIMNGHVVGTHIAGWCIFITDKTLNTIGSINERVTFWYSDNILAEQLIFNEIKHGLVCSSFVTHVGSRTLESLPTRQRNEYTVMQKKNFMHERNMIIKQRRNKKLI